jgi:hypothetical protein
VDVVDGAWPARALVSLVTDSGRREAMSAHNVAVAPRHDWDAAVTAFDSIYASAGVPTGIRVRT